MKKLFFFLAAFALLASPAFSDQFIRCLTDEYLEHKKEENPAFRQAFDQTYDYIYDLASTQRDMTDSVIYRVPVVVHVVYNTPEENIHDSLIHNQIEVLNEDFRRRNADTSMTREIFKPYAGDAGIEFFLAETDPNGNPTDGITRTQTSVETFFNFLDFEAIDNVKLDVEGGKDAWPTDQYMNLWVCNLSLSFGGNQMPAVLGFAYPPVGAPNWPADVFPNDPNLEGVVVHYQVFGRNNPEAVGPLEVVNRGRTTTHEVGHYLGLRHIWGDGGGFGGGDGCDVDDGIDDTPNSASSSDQSCDYTKNTCVISPVNYPDMIENFMDYSDENCMNMFTKGQIAVMRMALSELRPGLAEVDENVSFIAEQNTNTLNLYPNPANTNVYISFEQFTTINKIMISDIKGREIKQKAFHNQDYKTLSVNVEDLKTGMYIISVQTGDKLLSSRVMIQ